MWSKKYLRDFRIYFALICDRQTISKARFTGLKKIFMLPTHPLGYNIKVGNSLLTGISWSCFVPL